MTEPLTPKFMKLYRCRYGFKGGEQVCMFTGYAASGGYVVRKWRGNSGRWTQPVVVREADLLGRATYEDIKRNGVDVSRLS